MAVQQKDLTRGTKKLIKEAIIRNNSCNRHVLCADICDELEKKFKGDTLDYQLKRMDMRTTKDVLSAIDTYIFRYAKESDFKRTEMTED